MVPRGADIINELHELREEIVSKFNVVFTFVGISTVDLSKAQEYKLEKGLIKSARFTEEELSEQQKQLNNDLQDINSKICEWNREEQQGITPHTVTWENLVLRPTKKRNRSGLLRTMTRLDHRSLCDSIHAVCLNLFESY